MDRILYLVVPCYNEEEVLPITCEKLLELFERMRADMLINSFSKILFVDDGSKDATWSIISELSSRYDEIEGLRLSRNCGHQRALLAGLMHAKKRCDCAVSIDADLQDDIEKIPEMIKLFEAGSDIVYGVRDNRDTDTAFKKCTAQFFYKIMHFFGAEVVYNHADYRLMSRRSLEALGEFGETNLFLRGLVPLVGFTSSKVYYSRLDRAAGKTKYPLKRMISFALDGITSFSISPIRIISALGFVACVISVAMAFYAVVSKIMGNTDTGWASLMVSLWFIGGVQLLSLGIIGEYIGKTYKEVKKRPRYIIAESTERIDD